MKVDRVFLKSNKIIQLNRWEIKIRPGLKEKDFDATRKAIEKLNPDEKMTNVPKGIYIFGTQKIGSEGWLGSNDIRSVVRKDDHFIFITDNRKWEATVSGYKRPNYIGCAVPGTNMGSVKKFHNKHRLSLD